VEPGLLQLDLDRILPNRQQPRQDFNESHLEELAASLKRDGVLQPVVVRSIGNDEYELIAGERRWRAAQIAGLLKIPALVKEIPEDRILEIALIENIQREELNAVEEAFAYQTLIDRLGLTQAAVSERVGKPRATIANALRLLNLAEPVQQQIREGRLAAGHAKALAGLTDSKAQIALAQRIVDQGLSVRQVESIVAASSRRGGIEKVRSASPRDPNVVAAEEALQSAIGTKVKIHQGRRGTGRLELHFFSDEELERVYKLVMGAARSSIRMQ